MDFPLSVVVGLVVLVAAIAVVARAVRPGSVLRLRIPGAILFGLGLALLGSQLPPGTERLLLGLAMLIAWGGTGLALLAGRVWARVPGLVVSWAGFAVACWVSWRGDQWANELARSDDRILVDIFFLADGPYYSWIEVGLGSLAFAVLSAIAGTLLLVPIRRAARGSGPAPDAP